MRRAALVVLSLSLVMAPAAAAKQASTPVRITAPSAANATVAGFELDLVRVKKKAGRATAIAAAAAFAGAVGRGVRTTLSMYCPEGTPMNMNDPFAAVVLMAVSNPESVDNSASAPVGTRRSCWPATGPSGPVTMPDTCITGTGLN